MNEQPLNMGDSVREIWRRRLLIVTVALICGFATIAYEITRPAESSAVAWVLLPPNPPPTSNTPTPSIQTETLIAQSNPVLAAAGSKLSPPLGATELEKMLTVTGLSGQILKFDVRAADGTYATQIANAVADSYLAYLHQVNASYSAELATLQQQSASLTQQIQNLQYEIGAGQHDAASVALQRQQNQLALQLNSVNRQIATAELSSGVANGKAQILQRAEILPSSKIAPLVEMGIIGFVLGLVGSIAFVIIRRQRDRRLRLRDEIARTAGAPVIGSLEANGCETVAAWRGLMETRWPATAEWQLRHVIQTLATADERISNVRVISFAGDMPALTIGPKLGLFCAASGIPTILMPEEHHSLELMRAAFTSRELDGLELPLTVGFDGLGDDSSALLVSISVYEGELMTTAPPESVNVLSISSGFATAEELAHLALEAADAKSDLDYVIVVNPESSDMTSGMLAPGLPRRTPSKTRAPSHNGGTAVVPLAPRISITKESSERASRLER